MTVAQILSDATRRLANSGAPARLDAEVLLAWSLDRPRAFLYAWPEYALSTDQLDRFKTALERRLAGEPVAYITGRREFWSLPLRVTPAVLIPRPETELLVELALERIPREAKWTVIDLGTGSGAIGLALAHERRHCRLIATDQSADALAVARENATMLRIENIEFLQGEWLAAVGSDKAQIIVSNPPYVRPEDPHLRSSDVRFEPSRALVSKGGGLADLRSIAHQAREHLAEPGWLLVEHGFDQGAEVRALLEQIGYGEVATFSDLAGHPRATAGRWLGKRL